MDRYTVSSLVGQGSFGCVYKALRKADGKMVAIKVISKRGRSARELKNLRRECEIQARLKHPHVIEMIESLESKMDLYVITEFALMDLHRYLTYNGPMEEEPGRRVIGHLVSALYYLHANRILHRDLKPQNVLLDKNMHAKLCDFGLARNMTMGTHVLTSIKGTPLYMAPELLAEQPYDHQADLWSLGCIAYESLAGQPPFSASSIVTLITVIKHEDVKWPSTLSSECRSFLQGLLEKDPVQRTSWTQLLCHPFVEGRLFLADMHAEAAQESPFTNPDAKPPKPARSSAVSRQEASDLHEALAALSFCGNLSTSRDSINPIVASDVEHLETDVEDNIKRVVIPFADVSLRDLSALRAAPLQHPLAQHPLLAQHQLMAQHPLVGQQPLMVHHQPLVNSHTCFVSGNSNMILNHMNDNFPSDYNANARSQIPSGVRQSRSKDLEKRKLSQNMDNFSLRLGQSVDTEAHRKATEMLTQEKLQQEKLHHEKLQQEKQKNLNLKQSMQSNTGEEKLSSDNTPPLLPGWDSCDESQSPPIENDEWLAFLNRSVQEILDGELDSLKQHNLVSIIVAPLRNAKAIPRVLQSVAQLLSLPFVLADPMLIVDLEVIRNVYVDVKLVPNLMYACKLLLSNRQLTDSAASGTHPAGSLSRTLRSIPDLTEEELETASSLYELVCHLVHLQQAFLSQFCDAVAILSANELFLNFLTYDFRQSDSDAASVRLAGCILALLGCVLRELPENAELVERIVFSPRLRFATLLQSRHHLLRQRACQLLRLLARFSLRGVQRIWGVELRQALQELADNYNYPALRIEAAQTIDEISQFSFFVT
ncbi:serine/threonine-protein kinase fused [Drosophila bipectinata]|uniref:serine/threonine-protein kinase fused n=1 Tax=Drosophila bipectinata TaxID=42026 RepID=UPI001C8A76D5|nr:serine/threonine-protein kinase fused [Drosophila bipectinata]